VIGGNVKDLFLLRLEFFYDCQWTRGYETSSYRSHRDLNAHPPHVNQSAVRYNKQDAYDCNNTENTVVVSELIGSQNGGVIVIKGSSSGKSHRYRSNWTLRSE